MDILLTRQTWSKQPKIIQELAKRKKRLSVVLLFHDQIILKRKIKHYSYYYATLSNEVDLFQNLPKVWDYSAMTKINFFWSVSLVLIASFFETDV